MKFKFHQRLVSAALAVGMAATLLPVNALAATEVTPSPTQNSEVKLNVEYFTSTLYNWNESAANAATATADTTSSNYTRSSVYYSTVASSDASSYTATSYYYKSGDNYYPVYYRRTSSWSWNWGTTYTYYIYYYDGSSYQTLVDGSTSSYSTLTLYTATSSSAGKGLYFTGAGSKGSSVPAFSKWNNDNQNWQIYSGLAEATLSEAANAPFSNDNVNAANLFATSGNSSYADVYTNVQVPFVYDASTGYYELNSDKNAVYFDGGKDGAASNAALQIADQPAAHSYNNAYATGFFPFNDVTETVKSATESLSSDKTDSYVIDGSAEFGFGMMTSVNFKMTEDGQITTTDSEGNDSKQDIIFDFAGDDDVWVYVDGKLALDIGGTHDAIHGTINFRTGDVTLDAPAYKKIADYTGLSTPKTSGSATLSQSNLYTGVLGTTLADFADGGMHTLTIYYMERGRGRSNCQIKFNLPQSDTVSVSKQAETTKLSSTGEEIPLTAEEQEALNNTDFTMTLYRNGSVVANADYTLMSANGVTIGKYTTGADGKFTLKPSQTAVFDVSLDGTRSYYVVEDNPNTDETGYDNPNWAYASNIEEAVHTEVTSNVWTSDTYTATGSKETADTMSITCINQLSYVPDVKAELTDDVVVIDYNYPVSVNVLENDDIKGNITSVKVVKEDDDDKEDDDKVAQYGSAEVTTDNNVTYTLQKVLNEVDQVTYKVTAQDETDATATADGKATLSVVPASNVYYEDTFSETYSTGTVGIIYSGEWTTEGTAQNSTQSSDNSVVYGQDASNDKDLTDSNGSSQVANAGATATFSFAGTGVDIYSRSSTDSCNVRVMLYNADTGKIVQYAVANNYAYQGTYYSVPTVTFTGLEYGNYKVVLTVTANSTNKDAVNYYLDGIRVYNPLGTVSDGSTVAGAAYAEANELNAVYTEIRSLLLDGSATTDFEGVSGFSFIDKTDDETYSLSTYAYDGPKNEAYLANGQGIAFKLTNFEEGDAVYVGIKSAKGDAGTVMVTNGDGQKAEIPVNSTADQYYQIIPDSEGNVVITNNSDAVIALTKVRTTSPDTNDIDFSAISNEALSTYAASAVGAYTEVVVVDNETSEETSEDTAVEDDTTDDSTSGGEVTIKDGSSDTESEPITENQSTWQDFLNRFFGWIRGRR